MKRTLAAIFLLLIALGWVVTPVAAQTYLFQVTKNEVNVFINSDGTMSIEYTTEFLNDPSASPIDFVDIGLPNENYDLGSIEAEIDGKPITDIQRSEYVDHGVALGLGSNAIQPGQKGTVHVWVARVERILFPSTEEESEPYASFQFMPNYFGSQYVNGTTDLSVALILPTGMKEAEPRYFPPQGWPGKAEPEGYFDDQGRVVYVWDAPQANSSSEYTFGGAFPARLVPETAITTPPAASSFKFDEDLLCCLGMGTIFAGFFGLTIYGATIGAKKRKMQYLPPKIAIEGHGIKRGLTSPEAAVLMELAPDKVLTMILFSVIKKGAASVVTKDPLKLKFEDPLPEGLQPYEIAFTKAFSETNKTEIRKELQTLMIDLVRTLTDKMKGFSRKETVAYYKDIMERAWQQVESAETPEVQMKKFDEYMGWTMMDDRFGDRTRDIFTSRPVFVPTWWGRYDPDFGHTAAPASFGGGAPSSSSGGGSVSMPTLPGGEFAASMVGGIQNFAGNVIGDLTGFTSTITNKTNPIPPPSKSSGGRPSRGGGGCACACACAGCACACAGGGR